MRVVHGVEVFGSVVDDQTRCRHFASPLDIVAIKFKCCGQWFPCRTCHDESVNHPTSVWPKNEFETQAALCGSCGSRLSITKYLEGGDLCQICASPFNPGCRKHHHLYFATDHGTNP